nr:60S acidic ribosomal protein P1-like [Desmodus rotundus]
MRPSLYAATSTPPAVLAQHSSTLWPLSPLAFIYSALILRNRDKNSALANINMGSLIRSAGAGGPTPAVGAVPSITAAPAEQEKVEAKKEESEESGDNMGFDLVD